MIQKIFTLLLNIIDPKLYIFGFRNLYYIFWGLNVDNDVSDNIYCVPYLFVSHKKFIINLEKNKIWFF